jgi:predicted ATPase
VEQLRRGIAAWRATGAELAQPHWLALFAETCGRVDRVGEGLAALTEALERADRHGERYYEAELHRLHGELLLRQPNAADDLAEACFHRALDIARRQQAKSPELRAGVSLSRLWRRQGQLDRARASLAELHRWFTEGFDTRDLQEARALLEELS